MCRVSARRLAIYNFAWGLLKATKKYPKSEKNKDTCRIYPTKFESSAQKHKKVIETPNQPIEIKKISNKSIFRKKAKIRTGATRRSLQAQSKILKKLSEHQIYQSGRKFFQKKYAKYLKKEKEPKIRMGATRRNLQAQPKFPKKSSKLQRKFSQKLCFIP
jgi:hypothetical protein